MNIDAQLEEASDMIIEAIRLLSPNLSASAEAESDLHSDLGYHSLALVELAFTLEEMFEVGPASDEDFSIATVEEVIDYLVGVFRERGFVYPTGHPDEALEVLQDLRNLEMLQHGTDVPPQRTQRCVT